MENELKKMTFFMEMYKLLNSVEAVVAQNSGTIFENQILIAPNKYGLLDATITISQKAVKEIA